MPDSTDILLAVLIFLAAALYSSVGHAGASGYLAAMALMSVDPSIMKPTALCLNVLVAAIATVQFMWVGAFSWRLFWPFAATSIPLAFVGGRMTLPGHYYRPLVAVVLLLTAIRLFFWRTSQNAIPAAPPRVMIALLAGAIIGLLAGLTGTGGGIFLTPLLLFLGWAQPRDAAGVTAAFILVNSIAGLAGLLSGLHSLPAALPWWAAAAFGGGVLGSYLGSRRLGNIALRRVLAVVLIVAAVKFITT